VPEPLAPRQIGVVVPANNEELSIGSSLASIIDAARGVAVPVTILVVLDACTDGSLGIVRSLRSARDEAAVEYIEVTVNCVGTARRAGVADLLRRLGAHRTWLATTDADTVVPPNWLSAQLTHAAMGAHVVVGTVAVGDWHERLPHVRALAINNYGTGPTHRHIHGANLSFSARAYAATGGFEDRTSDEDVALVESFRINAEPIAWAIDLPVTTSARRNTRTPGGFGTYLTSLEAEP
jgi:glycosyltransferase involved in cell wall biosynthesis